MRLLSLLVLLISLMGATAAQAKLPFFNATCPGGIEVHADAGGPIYINGKESKLKVFNANYYEASLAGTTISVSVNPDGTPSVSYSAKGGGTGICTVGENSGDDNATAPDMTPAQMTAYCKGEGAGKYNTSPSRVSASAPMKAVGGGYVVTGSVSLGAQGNPPFQCLFDRSGHFLSIDWL